MGRIMKELDWTIRRKGRDEFFAIASFHCYEKKEPGTFGCADSFFFDGGLNCLLYYFAGQLAQVIVVDAAVAVEGSAALGMSGHLADDIGIMGQLVRNSDEGSAGHVAGCHIADGLHLIVSRCRVEDLDNSGDTTLVEDLFQPLIVFLRTEEGE